jgi:hypothetical protein
VRRMFVTVWGCLPGGVEGVEVLGEEIKEGILSLAIAAALPFLRRALLLRAVVLGAPLPPPRITATALEQAVYLLGVLGLSRQFSLDEAHRALFRRWRRQEGTYTLDYIYVTYTLQIPRSLAQVALCHMAAGCSLSEG